MEGLLRDPAQYSQLELLVTQQRYDESLQLLNEAIAKNPQDRDACLCRLLVVRIVVLRRQLSEFGPLRFSKRKVHLLGSALARPTRRVLQALYRAGNSWPHGRPIFRLRAMGELAVSQAGRLRRFATSSRARPDTNVGPSFGLFAGERDFQTPPRKRLPILAVSALSIVAIVSVSLALLRNHDASGRPTFVRPTPVQVVSRGAQQPQAPGLPATVTQREAAAEKIATPASTTASEAKPAGKEHTAVGEPQEPAPAKSDIAPEKPKEVARARPAAEAKAQATKSARHADVAAKKKPPAAHQDSVEVVDASKLSKAGAVAKSSSHFYRARRPIAVRQAAKYAAPTVERLSEGAVVAVLDVKNSWARVTLDGKAPGFVRIEHLGPVEIP